MLITALVSLHMINHLKAMVTQHMYACAQPINRRGGRNYYIKVISIRETYFDSCPLFLCQCNSLLIIC